MADVHEGLMRPFITLDIEVAQPIPPTTMHRPFTGRLKGAMYRAGAVHHFRVVDAQGVMWLVPPGWLSAFSLQVAEMAFDCLGASFLHAIQTVPRDLIWKALAAVTDMPDGLTPKEMVARLEQRRRQRQPELVH